MRCIILMLKQEIKWNHAQLKPEKAGKDIGKKGYINKNRKMLQTW